MDLQGITKATIKNRADLDRFLDECPKLPNVRARDIYTAMVAVREKIKPESPRSAASRDGVAEASRLHGLLVLVLTPEEQLAPKKREAAAVLKTSRVGTPSKKDFKDPIIADGKCLCGCGKSATRTFLPGHDARMKSRALAVLTGKLPATALADEQREYLHRYPKFEEI